MPRTLIFGIATVMALLSAGFFALTEPGAFSWTVFVSHMLASYGSVAAILYLQNRRYTTVGSNRS